MAEVGTLRVSLGLDSANFTTSLEAVNRKLRLVDAEFKAATGGVKDFENSLEGLQIKAESLTQKLQLHEAKVAELKRRYEESAQTKGKDAAETEKLLIAYNKAVAEMKKTEAQLQQTNKEIEKQSNGFNKLEQAVTQSLQKIDQQLKVIDSEFRAATAGIENFGSTSEQLRTKANSLAQTLELQKTKVSELKQLYDESVKAKGADAKETNELLIAYNKATAEMKETEAQLRQLNQTIEQQATAWGQLQTKLNETGQRLQDVGNNLQSSGAQIAASFGVASAAIGGALGSAVKKSADFEAQLSRVGAVADATPAELEKLKQAALDLGATTSKSATEVAQGMEIMGQMGYSTNQILAAMPGVIAAAEASGEDMALVADTVSAALNSFGLEASEASRVADVLAQAANDSAAGIQDMQYTFKYAAPVAKSLGISLEELAAATEIMANNGIRGEQAGTTLRGALIRLSDPPKEAREALAELGIQVTDSQGRMLPFGDIIGQLSEKTKNMSNAQKLAALSTIFGTEAASGMLTVIEAGPQKLDSLTKSLQNSSGASKEAAEKMKDNLKGALEELGGAIETAQISIGDALAPAIRIVAEALQGLFNAFNSLPSGMQQFIAIGAAISAVLLGIVASIGIVLSIIGTAMQGFGALASVMASAGGMAGVFSSAIAVITGPVGIAIGAIAGLVAIGVVLYKNWDEIKVFLSATWETIKSAALAIWEGIKAGLAAIWEGIKTVAMLIWEGIKAYFTTMLSIYVTIFSAVWEGVKTVLTTIWEAIKTIATTVWEGIKTFFSTVLEGIKTAFSTVWEAIKTALSTVWETIKTTATTVWEGIKTFFSTVLDGIKTTFSTVWDTIKGALETVWNTLKSTAETVWNGVKTFFETTLNAIKTTFTTIWNTTRDTVIGVWNTLKSKAQEIFNTLASFLSTTWNNVKNTAVNTWNTIKSTISNIASDLSSAVQNTFNSLKSAISNIFNGVKSTLINIWEGIKSEAKSWASGFVEVGKDLLRGIWEGMKSLDDWLWDKVRGMLSGLTDKIKEFFGIRSPSRLFAEYGGYLSQGLAIGITDDAKLAENSVVDMAKRVAKAGQQIGNIALPSIKPASIQHVVETNVVGNVVGSTSSGGITIIIENMVVRNDEDIYRISRELYSISQSSRKAKGMR
ncbi:Phage tail length tape-measure protein [Geobacillus stearothermophilus]|uniref:phage tail tape measure protein n=1 Tax=Geobacillus stearothermophilus TaxID=1422 RepID=UPI0007D9ACC6|nr:phage tail tape measure protein [Geobacillus stearothermophilus]OAO77822.1 Phage tail length tape-measure protein [Geobacillus stearothermophilus]